MEGRVQREKQLAALSKSLDSGDLESVKRAADSFHRVGGDPVTALSGMAFDELPDSERRTLALRALEDLDSSTGTLIARRLGGFSEAAKPQFPAKKPLARVTVLQSDQGKWWIFGPLIALAILWPAYSVYRFNHPKAAKPPAGAETSGTASPPTVATTQDQRISGDHRFGCTDREYFENLVGYAVQKDSEAFNRALAAGIFAGACTSFKSDEAVYVTDTAIFSGLVKVRRKGEVQEYWTNLESVK